MTKRSRDRQLAKLAARRQADRHAQQRRRSLISGIIVGTMVVGLAIGGGISIFGKDTKKAGGTPTPTPSISSSPTPAAKPGKQTGTVKPQPAPTTVACGAKAPPGAGKPKPQFSAPAQVLDKKATYIATFDTSCGIFTVELDAKSAPQTVNSFVFLAQQGYFDGQYFHRLDTSIDVVQGGDPTGTGTGGPGYSIPDEYTGSESYSTGTFAMANTGQPNSGGSQFFIITGPNGAGLPPQYTVFGHITKGPAVAQKIQKLPIKDPAAAASGDLTGQAPKDAVYINSVTITKK